jgi:Phosphate-selective porin O and P
VAGSAVALALSGGTAVAQTTYPNVKLSGRLQEQFYYFDNDDYAAVVGPNSNVFTRRARVEARGQISENVSLFIQPSFEGGRTLSNLVTTCTSDTPPVCRTTGRSGFRLRDAYIDVRFGSKDSKGELFVRAGQEKRPFSRYELTSSTNLPTIERGAGPGLLGRASNDLFGSAGFLSHDVGASVRYEYELGEDRLVTLKLGVYNGQGESLNDVNDRKSFGARGTVAVTPKLEVGISWFAHDAIVTVGGTPDSSFSNHAFDIDASWGKPGDEGLYALGEYLQGDDASELERGMRGIQLLGAYHIRTSESPSWIYAIEPAVRLDIADPDTDTEDDRSTLLTGVLGLYFSSRAQFRVAFERQSFEGSATPSISGLRSALTVNF